MAVSGGGVEALFWRGPVTPGDAAQWLSPGVLQDGAGSSSFIPGSAILGGAGNPLVVRTLRIAPWDDFDAADATSLTGRITPSGHTWGITGAGGATASISKQGYVNTALSYAFLTDSQVITECECIVSWVAVASQVGAQGTNGTFAFTSDAVNPVSGTSKLLHLQFSSESWNLLKSTAGPAGLTTLTGTPVELNSVPSTLGTWYGTNLKLDGTRYKIRMVTDSSANTLTIYFPDGTVWRWTDTDVSVIMAACKTSFWEHSGNGTAGFASLYFNGCAIGPSKAGEVIEASSNKDTALNRSVFASTEDWAGQIPYPQPIVKTSTGWYTIATESTDTPVAKMGGTVTVFGKDASGVHCLFEMVVGAEVPSSGAPVTQNIFTANPLLGAWAGGVVDQVRLSGDQSTGLINLDIHISTSSAVTLYAQYRGMFTPVVGPVVGATVLTSWSSVLTLAFASQTAPMQWNFDDKSSTMTLSNSNLTGAANATAEAQVRSTTSHSVGKFYAELTTDVVNGAAGSFGFGLSSASHLFSAYIGSGETPRKSVGYWSDGSVLYNGAGLLAANANTDFQVSQTIAIAIDMINYKIYVINLTTAGNWNNNVLADPATGVGGLDISTLGFAPFFLTLNIETNGDKGTLNAGTSSFVGALPNGGYVAWG